MKDEPFIHFEAGVHYVVIHWPSIQEIPKGYSNFVYRGRFNGGEWHINDKKYCSDETRKNLPRLIDFWSRLGWEYELVGEA